MRHRSSFRTGALLLSLLLGRSALAAWHLAPIATDESGALCVAAATDGRVAVGDGRGVRFGDDAESTRRIDVGGASRDLAFAADGALWIASERGLHRFAGGRAELRAPAPGDLARDALRVATSGAAVAVATSAGVFFAPDGERFARIGVPASEAAASGVALEATPAGIAVWIASARGVFRATPNGPIAQHAERVALPVDLRAVVDVAVYGDRVLVLAAEWLAERGEGGAWTTQRLVLPPGATPMRVAAGAHGVWIATDRGIVAAPSSSARFARASDPAGTTPANDVAVAGGRVWVATARGVLVGDAHATANGVAAAPPADACDPPVYAVQRAALAHLQLSGDPAAAMRRGVRVRGLLPVVTLDAARARDDFARRTYDQAYVSGGYRHLHDRGDDRRRDEEVSLRLTWDLGDVAYHPEQIDVSTEARRLIELRDDVLDELNQLYFDRQRALASLAALAPDSPEAAGARLRAAELAAGLDAWTDGWFGRVASCAASHASPPR